MSLCRYVFARVFSVSVLRAALIHRYGGPPSPMGKVIGLRLGVYEFARGFLLRQSVPPLIRRLRAAPSPVGKVGAQSKLYP